MLVYARVLLSILLLLSLFQPLMVQAGKTSESILIISSYNPAAHQTTVTISDFIDQYTKLGGCRNIEIENMNCKSFSEATRWKSMMAEILSKYRGSKTPGLIVLLGQEAWASYLAQDDSIVGQVPVMCSLASRNTVALPADSIGLKDWMPESTDFFNDYPEHREVRTGFVYEYDITANINMIKQFYPDTQHIAFLSDNTYGGVSIQALMREEMQQFPELELILLDGRSNTIYTIVDKFRELPEHTVVMVCTKRLTDLDEQRNYYEIIQTNSDLLLRLINDILDLSRLEANRITLAFEQFDVVMLCRQVLATVDAARKSGGNTFVFVSTFNTYLLTTDIQRMQQVLINLLTNAAKFTTNGTITLSFEVDAEHNRALFSVTDTGSGIPLEKQKQVFERFEKLNEYAQGTGLGLAICKLTVDKWGGEIWIDPDYTDGARFVFTHPLTII